MYFFYFWMNCPFNNFLSSRPGEGRSSPGLLGPGSGHPLLQWVPEGVLPTPLHPPLPRLWPGSVWRLLSGAPLRALPRLGPPGEGLQWLQPETWGALAGQGGAGVGSGRRPLRKLEFTTFNIWLKKALVPFCLFLVAFHGRHETVCGRLDSVYCFLTPSSHHVSPLWCYFTLICLYLTLWRMPVSETWISRR